MIEHMPDPRLDEIRYRVFKVIESNPRVSQRELADALGVSLGKVNYCLQELVKKGFVKVGNFKNSQSKRAYLYYLTPTGAEEKVKVTYRFLRAKIDEFEALKAEIDQLAMMEEQGIAAGARRQS